MTSEAHAHPLVTIVLRVRNEADRIEACLESRLR